MNHASWFRIAEEAPYVHAPETGPITFVERLPLQLKNKVSAKSDKGLGKSQSLIFA